MWTYLPTLMGECTNEGVGIWKEVTSRVLNFENSFMRWLRSSIITIGINLTSFWSLLLVFIHPQNDNFQNIEIYLTQNLKNY
jgi:hypothetical protein